MEKITIVGAARDARTRQKRKQAGTRRRRVRIGGIYRVRPSRSIQFNHKQCLKYEEELRGYFDAGLILFQDGRGRPVDLDAFLGDEDKVVMLKPVTSLSPAELEEGVTRLNEIAARLDEEEATKLEGQGPEEPEPEQEPEDTESDADEGDEGMPYTEWEYPDLKTEVKDRELEPESQSKVHLIEALEADDESDEEE